MRVTRAWPGRLAVPALRRQFVFDVTRGVIRVRAWPRKRGTPRSPWQRMWNDWFKQVNRQTKTMDPGLWWLAYAWARYIGLYPRDVVLKWTAGKMFDIVLNDGRTLTFRHNFIEDVMYQGAKVQRTSTFGIASGADRTIFWQTPIIDTAGAWNVANADRLTIPVGVEIASFSVGLFATGGSSAAYQVGVKDKAGNVVATSVASTTSSKGQITVTGPVPVTPGDWYTAFVNSPGGGTLQPGSRSFFAMDILQVVT